MKGYLLFLSVLTLVLELKLAGKRLWNEEEKIAKKPFKCQKDSLFCEDLVFLSTNHALSKGGRPWERTPKCCWEKTMFSAKKYCMLRWFMSRLIQGSGSDWRSLLINREESWSFTAHLKAHWLCNWTSLLCICESLPSVGSTSIWSQASFWGWFVSSTKYEMQTTYLGWPYTPSMTIEVRKRQALNGWHSEYMGLQGGWFGPQSIFCLLYNSWFGD